jgi:adenosylhomocysteine nucleosidase
VSLTKRFSEANIVLGAPLIADRLGIVVGMTSEARIARVTGCALAVGGGTPRGARRMAQRLVDDGVSVLISFGLAGGLDPALPAGALLVPRSVLSQDTAFTCDERISAALEGERIDSLLAGHEVVATAVDKARLWRESGAGAVDLESGAVAEVAAANGLPFAVMRAVCDPATRDLPRAAVEALDEQGRVKPLTMAGILARHPVQIMGLVALGLDAARARKSLIRGAESLRRFAACDTNLGRRA